MQFARQLHYSKCHNTAIQLLPEEMVLYSIIIPAHILIVVQLLSRTSFLPSSLDIGFPLDVLNSDEITVSTLTFRPLRLLLDPTHVHDVTNHATTQLPLVGEAKNFFRQIEPRGDCPPRLTELSFSSFLFLLRSFPKRRSKVT